MTNEPTHRWPRPPEAARLAAAERRAASPVFSPGQVNLLCTGPDVDGGGLAR